MKIVAKALIAGFILVAGVAVAEDVATDPTVIAREAVMKTLGKNAKILGEMAGDKVAFDAAAAAAAKAEMAAAQAEIAAKFTDPATDPASKALPAIWTSWDDFVKKSDALGGAIGGLDASTLEGVKAGMGAIGGACKDCHTSYRAS